MKLKKELRAVKEINEQERKKRDDGENCNTFHEKTRQLKEGDTLLTLFGFKTIQINPIKQRGNSINQGFSKSN